MHSLLKFIAATVRIALCAAGLLALALVLFLNACSRRVPDALARRIEDELCTDAVCARFDTMSFSVAKGPTFNHVRIYLRGVLGQPLVEIDELRVGLSIRFGRPADEWLDSISLRGIDFRELPDFDAIGALLADSGEKPADPGAAFSWMTRPIDIEFADFNMLGTKIDTLTARAALRGRVFRLEDIRMRWAGANWPEHAIGEITHDIDVGGIRLTLDGYATPTPLYPIFRALGANSVVRLCDDFSDFHGPFETRLELLQKDFDSPTEIKVSLRGNNFSYLGMPFLRARAVVSYSEGGVKNLVKVRAFEAEHETGAVTGELGLDPDFTFLSLDLKSTAAVPVIARVVADFNAELASNVVKAVVFEAPPAVTVAGKVSVDGEGTADLRGHITAEHPFTVVDIPVANADSDYELTEKRCDFPNVVATAFGGTVTGAVHLAEKPGTTNWEWTVRGAGTAKNLKFGDFCRDVIMYTNSFGGILNANFDLSAPLERRAFPSGTVHAKVHDGVIARIPLFAGFTDYLAKNIPGIDTMVTQSDISGDFVFTNRQLRTENLLVEGGFFSMRAGGRYRDSNRSLDFLAKVRLFREKTLVGKLVRIVVFPVNKLLEFRVYGTADNPEWRYIGLIDRVIDIFRSKDEEDD